MTKFRCRHCDEYKSLLFATCKACSDRIQNRVRELEKVWEEFLVTARHTPKGGTLGREVTVCGLCGGDGEVTARIAIPSPDGSHPDTKLAVDGIPCICPAGRAIKEKANG